MFQVKNLFAIFAAVFFVGGCTTGTIISMDGVRAMTPSSPAEVAANVAIVPDIHEGRVKVVGPPVFDRQSDQPAIYRVDTVIDPKRPGQDDRFSIFIVGMFPKRVLLDEVMTRGRSLKAKLYDRERMDCGYGCAVVESLIVTVTEADMRIWAVIGLPLKVSGRRTSFIMFIPAAYFKAVLDRHRQAVQALQGKV